MRFGTLLALALTALPVHADWFHPGSDRAALLARLDQAERAGRPVLIALTDFD